MSNIEKALSKAVEALKIIHTSQPDESVSRRKEKIASCVAIADALCQSNMKNPSNLDSSKSGNILSNSFEALFQLCDDVDSHVRLVADESLNRIIRSLLDSHCMKVMVELHKEIKKNGKPHSLRAALWRFAELAHNIRPQKGRTYVQNTLPCLIEIARRREEAVLETLASSIPKILAALGIFTTDSDIKMLLRSFFTNLTCEETVIRRTAALSIVDVCLHSRKPSMFLSYVLNALLECVVPVKSNQNLALLLGVLTCVRYLLPHLVSIKAASEPDFLLKPRSSTSFTPNNAIIPVDRFIQIYELCLHYCGHSDSNVVTASLETLHQLLLSEPKELKEVLVSKNMLTKSRIHANNSQFKFSIQRSISLASVATSSVIDESHMSEGDMRHILIPTHFDQDADDPKAYEERSEDTGARLRQWLDASENCASPEPPLTADQSASQQSEYSNIQIGAVKDDTLSEKDCSSLKSGETPKEKEVFYKMESTEETRMESDVAGTCSPSKSCDLSVTHSEAPQVWDIGSVIDGNSPLNYCVRRLITGFLLTEQSGVVKVRVSTKALALNCLTQALRLEPSVGLLNIDNTGVQTPEGFTSILDVVLSYSSHSDQQLRGLMRVLIGHFIFAALRVGKSDYSSWLQQHECGCNVSLEALMKLLIQGLGDESSVCTRLSLGGVSSCLNSVILTNDKVSLEVLYALLKVATNPYWLVKVKLLETISTLPFINIKFLTGNLDFQNSIVHNIILSCLGDNDSRVRKSAAECLSNIVQYLYTPIDQSYEHEIIVSSKTCEEQVCEIFNYNPNAVTEKLKRTMNVNQRIDQHHKYHLSIDAALSRILELLSKKLLDFSSKYIVLGSCEALCLLSSKYPCYVYQKAWQCMPVSYNAHEQSALSISLFSNVLSLLNSSAVCLDLEAQNWLCILGGNLFVGLADAFTKSNLPSSPKLSQTRYLWSFFQDKRFESLAETLLLYLIRLTNVFTNILNEPQPNQNITAPALRALAPPTISPMKRKNRSLSPTKSLSDSDKKEEKSKSYGNYSHLSRFSKLQDMLKATYSNIKVTLSPEPGEKFFNLLETNLNVLSKILNFMTLEESGRIADELLFCLKFTFPLKPTETVKCVLSLLQSIFSTNQLARYSSENQKTSKISQEKEGNDPSLYSLYNHCFQTPFQKFSDYIEFCAKDVSFSSELNDRSTGVNNSNELVRDRRSSSFILKSPEKSTNTAVLTSYIKLSESMIITALNQCIVTSNVELQGTVIAFMTELVFVGVNYWLLDSNQFFIKFVLTLFEYLEAGQIRNSKFLVPKVFNFLVHLSNDKNHSKPVMCIPKVIQLCDGLIASGQRPEELCIPALFPIVEHVFLIKTSQILTTEELKELKTQREVLFAMLLRLIYYQEALHLLSLIITHDQDGAWSQRSRLIFDTLSRVLPSNQLKIDSIKELGTFLNLLSSLSPSIFSSPGSILKILFSTYLQSQDSDETERWIAVVLSMLLLLISTSKESDVLPKIEELELCCLPLEDLEDSSQTSDPLNVTASSQFQAPPNKVLARYLLRIIALSSTKLHTLVFNSSCDSNGLYLSQLTSCLLLTYISIFQSGSFVETVEGITEIFHDPCEGKSIQSLIRVFSDLSIQYPALNLQWFYLLSILNLTDDKFWLNATSSTAFDMSSVLSSNVTLSCNVRISKLGLLLLYCDHLSENIGENLDKLEQLLDNHLHTLITMFNELPVKNLTSVLSQNYEANSLLLDKLKQLSETHHSPVFINRLVKCLESSHPDLSGKVILFVTPNFLQNQSFSSARQIASLSCRKIEYLLTRPKEEVQGLIPEDTLVLYRKELFNSPKLLRRHPNLFSLMNKLTNHCYDLPPLEGGQNKPLDIDSLRNVSVDKAWLNAQVRLRCCRIDCSPVESASLLKHLQFDDILEILRCQQFNNSILQHCFEVREKPSVNMQEETNSDVEVACSVSPLYLAARKVLLSHVHHLKSFLPRVQQVYKPLGRVQSMKEEKYSEQMDNLFASSEFYELLYQLIPAVIKYFESIRLLPELLEEDAVEEFLRFAVLCMEVLHWTLSGKQLAYSLPSCLQMVLHCNCLVFKLEAVQNIVSDIHICSVSSTLMRTVEHLINESLELMSNAGLERLIVEPDSAPIAHACYQMSSLINWLQKFTDIQSISAFIYCPLKDLIIAVSRLKVVNSYLRVSPDAWKHSGWYDDLKSISEIPALPLFCLQDIDILNQLVYRVSLLGWRNRQQFEETWMLILTVLNTPLEVDAPPEEIMAVIQTISIGVTAVTSLLIGTLRLPNPGNISDSQIIHSSRYNLDFLSTQDWGQKLIEVNKLLAEKINDVHSSLKFTVQLRQFNCLINAERICSHKRYGYNQVSVHFLRTSVRGGDTREETNLENEKHNKLCIELENALQKSGLDLSSCLQFLIDLYAQWMSQKRHLPLLYEVIRSIVIISDLFRDHAHFQWMLGASLLFHKMHLIEDDILSQYLIVAVCKSAAVLQNVEPNIFSKVIKILDSGLKSSFLPSRVAALHSLLYLLESYVMLDYGSEETNTTQPSEAVKFESKSIFYDLKNILDDEKESDSMDGDLKSSVEILLPSKYYAENSQAVLHIAIDFVEKNLNAQLMGQYNEEFQLCTISIGLYLIEKVKLDEVNQSLCQTIIHVLLELCKISSNLKHYSVYQAIIQGFERLILTQKYKNIHSQIMRLAIDRFSHSDTLSSIIALQLFMSCFYTQKLSMSEDGDSPTNGSDPEMLISKRENISTFFERIKVSSSLEVEVICSVLPKILTDFFPASDLLSKVIGEFLSPYQPHPHCIANIVFKVFEKACEEDQLPLIQDWIVTSLTSLTRGLSIAMATWCLTCFFISASVNPCLRALFPHVQSRIGRFEYEDRKLLCISASHFYHSLASEELKSTFLKTFQNSELKTSQNSLTNPFSSIVQCLQ